MGDTPKFGVYMQGTRWVYRHDCGNGKTKSQGNYKDQEQATIAFRLHKLDCEADR